MGVSESSSAYAEGRVDDRPCVFFYKKADDEEEIKLSLTKGHKVYPDAKWTHILAKNFLGIAPVDNQTAKGDYHFLYVEENPAAQHDSTKSPVVFKSAILHDPPGDLVRDVSMPSGTVCWEFRQDRAEVHPNFHIIVSTESGTGLASEVWKHLVKPLLDYMKLQEGTQYELHFTTSETSVSELTYNLILPQANLGVAQAILLMSGDGGVVDIVNSLLLGVRGNNYKKPNISIMPLGTGNALAHSAGITADNTIGLKSWMRGQLKELPLFAATFSPGARVLFDEARQEKDLHSVSGVPTAHGAVVCSWGLHAGLVADSDTVEYRKFGAERFKMAAKEALFPSDGSPPHAYKGNVSILCSGQEGWQQIRRGEHAYILATLVSYLEKGFNISPSSKPMDGKLRLVHFGLMSGEAAMEIMGKAYQGGQHVQDTRVGYGEIEALRIEFQEDDAQWRRVCIDGKIIRVEKGGWIEVRTGQKGVVDLIVE